MKQITMTQASELALKNRSFIEQEIRYCQADFLRENAFRISDIESKTADKTYYGEYPKGWKHAMKEYAKEHATRKAIDLFLQNECMLLDGAIWLGNWQLINEMEASKNTHKTKP